MTQYFGYLIFLAWALNTLVITAHVLRRNDRVDTSLPALPTNSKFLDPQLDDETNLQLIDGEYDDEDNATLIDYPDGETSRSLSDIFKSNSSSESITKSNGEEKFFGLGLLNFLKPMLGNTAGLGYGGLYGAQYYGLNGQGSNSRPLSSWIFPFYNYPYYNLPKSADSGAKLATE